MTLIPKHRGAVVEGTATEGGEVRAALSSARVLEWSGRASAVETVRNPEEGVCPR